MMPVETVAGQKNLPRYFSSAFEGLSDLKAGRLDMQLPDGRVFRIKGSEPGPAALIEVKNPNMFARVVRDGELGFAEAYMDEWWTTPDLQALLDVLLLSNDEIRDDLPGIALVRLYERLRHWLRSNSKMQARKNISAHYDLGNDFYGLWLDDTMSYSSALFKTGQEDMEAAQTLKYESICDVIGVKPGDRLLEIGCGWGGFAEHAAKTRGAKVTGLTISQQQHDYAKKRMFDAGLNDQVEIVMRDYRDETGKYDGIASIEMFEAVGEKYWPTYFNCVRDRLNSGAIAGLQIITVADHIFDSYRKSVDFIQKYIFPGGMLPSMTALNMQTKNSGLSVTELLNFGDSYSETLRRWHKDFNVSWDQVHALGFDLRFRRMWNFYLASCAACFRAKTTDVIQIGLTQRV